MNRPTTQSHAATPWGHADQQTGYAAGITFFSTPSHGGFYVSPTTRNSMPEPYRSHPPFCGKAGWYEEDCDWAVVALSFPQFFTADELEAARRTWGYILERKAESINPKTGHTFKDDIGRRGDGLTPTDADSGL